jgi:ABC-type nitrate/sulfonate/bicarbonate transport system substrate-binding protein
VSPQTKPVVKVGYIPSDSFAALYIMADRHLPAADVAVETVRLSGGSEILSQVATGQLNVGGTGMGAAGFNAVAASLPVNSSRRSTPATSRTTSPCARRPGRKRSSGIGDLQGRPVALNVRGAAVEWMLEQALKRDGPRSQGREHQDHAVPRYGAGARVGRRRGGDPHRAVPDPWPKSAESR